MGAAVSQEKSETIRNEKLTPCPERTLTVRFGSGR